MWHTIRTWKWSRLRQTSKINNKERNRLFCSKSALNVGALIDRPSGRVAHGEAFYPWNLIKSNHKGTCKKFQCLLLLSQYHSTTKALLSPLIELLQRIPVWSQLFTIFWQSRPFLINIPLLFFSTSFPSLPLSRKQYSRSYLLLLFGWTISAGFLSSPFFAHFKMMLFVVFLIPISYCFSLHTFKQSYLHALMLLSEGRWIHWIMPIKEGIRKQETYWQLILRFPLLPL